MQLRPAELVGAALVGIVAAPALAAAHTDDAAGPAGRMALAIVLVAFALLYARGRRRLGERWPRRRTAAAAAGAVAVAVALLSPLDAWAATNLAAHMVQHTVLILVAAPLLALGRPLAVMAAVLPRAPRLGRALGTPRPGVACAAHGVALWLWHLPPLYDVALARPLVHAIAHATLLGTAVFLWWSVSRGRARLIGALWLFVTAFHAGGLGALLALSTRPWFHDASLEQQQLAGLVMWVPAGGLLTAIALALFGGWLRAGARRASPLAVLATLLAVAPLVGCNRATPTANAMTGGVAARGPDAIRRYGCATCHTIPGVVGAIGSVGPPLTQVARRSYVAGAPNAPDHLVRWLEHPRRVRPGTPMPEMGVTERDARDIAAYLYTLR
jgi:cytochrome c oxidase assembly factor CtaG/cytochrome c2